MTCINAEDVPYPEHHRTSDLKGFALKAFALVYVTTFRRVLLLDADNMPLVDPGPLFQDPAFRSAGNLFWPDYWYNAWIDEGIYSMFKFPVPWEGNGLHHTTESGQLLFDRCSILSANLPRGLLTQPECLVIARPCRPVRLESQSCRATMGHTHSCALKWSATVSWHCLET